mmetsp:Transcript_16633/g.25641  ORF Transcript_16633/g.25641 Transcript_16633/m.25641 type:complete len:100 (+) Transcript_16633:1608-1907(+)
MIRQFNIFSKSQEFEIMYIASLMRARVTVAKETVISQGDMGDLLYIVVEGQVNVLLREPIMHRYMTKLRALISMGSMFKGSGKSSLQSMIDKKKREEAE